jgi:hypothetical protein
MGDGYVTEFGLPGARLLSVADVPDFDAGEDGDEAWSQNGTRYAKANGVWAPQQSGTSDQINWCQINLSTPPALTVGSPQYLYQMADLTIAHQSGTDFSIVEDANGGFPCGAIATAAGGRFQSAIYVGANQNSSATLDGGSTQQRWKEFFLSMGPFASDDPTDPSVGVGGLGIDTMLPILPNGSNNAGAGANTPVSSIGYASLGKICCSIIQVALVNGFGTDSFIANDTYALTIWSV